MEDENHEQMAISQRRKRGTGRDGQTLRASDAIMETQPAFGRDFDEARSMKIEPVYYEQADARAWIEGSLSKVLNKSTEERFEKGCQSCPSPIKTKEENTQGLGTQNNGQIGLPGAAALNADQHNG